MEWKDNVGTWQMREIANEMLKYKIDIIALQEIRW
jgi:mRNA deadenylase 3'-5' endonuclease subunit Ccr4